jgi:hypothetical protein
MESDGRSRPKQYPPPDSIGGDNKIGRHSLEDVSCQILLLALKKKKYFKFFLLVAMATRVLHEINSLNNS